MSGYVTVNSTGESQLGGFIIVVSRTTVTSNLDFGINGSASTTGFTSLSFSYSGGSIVNPAFNVGNGLTLSFTGTVRGFSSGIASQPLTTDGFYFQGVSGSTIPFAISGLTAADTVSLYAIDGWDGAAKAATVSFNGSPSVNIHMTPPGATPTVANFATIATNQVATGSSMSGYITINSTGESQVGGFIVTVNRKNGDLTASYTWKPLKIGGGGWLVGMWMHPTTAGLMYARADVSGAYRWVPATSSWKQIVTSSSLPAAYSAPGTYAGVDSVVGAPSDPTIAYMAFQGQIFKSTNQGDSWTATSFNTKGVAMNANGTGRQEGERLQVDPNNSSVVYYAPINDQPWMTADSGTTWTKVTGVPVGTAGHGVNTIKFDGASGTTGGKTNTIFITSDNNGVWKSTNAGAAWTNIATTGPGTVLSARDSAIGPDRTYYVVYSNDEGNLGAVWKYSSAGAWTNITPNGSLNYQGIAVDPTNGNRLTIIRYPGQTFTSLNQGSTYTAQSWNLVSTNVTWLGAQTTYGLGIGQLCYDPSSAGRLWLSEGFGVWSTTDIADTNITWSEQSSGIEEACANAVICPPNGKPVTAMWDIGAFYHNNPDLYNATRMRASFMAGWDLDWCPGTPSFVAGVFHDTTGYFAPIDATGYSTNGGMTWTPFPSVANSTTPANLKYGVIAVSATNTSHIVWCPPNTALPYYTTNLGSTWTQASFGGPTNTGFGNTGAYNFAVAGKPLAADRVNTDTFYFYLVTDGMYKSINGGANWTRVGNNPVNNRWNATLKAAPGIAGDLWFSEGQQTTVAGGLWHSTDGGATWTSVPGIDQAYNFGFGKAQTGGSGYPTIFVAGVVGGVNGIFRSVNGGGNWSKICGYPLGIFDYIDAMDGDKNTFGEVYLGFAGTGFAYGVTSGP